MSTGKSDLCKWLEDHDFPYFLLSYTEDQAGQYIRPKDELRTRNGNWFTDEKAEQFQYNNTMGTVTYGTCERCMESGPVQQACTACMRPSCCGYVIIVYPQAQGTNTVHQLSRAVINIWNKDEQGNGRQESKVDKQPEHKTPATRHEGKDCLTLPE